MPKEGVEALVEFLKEYEQEHNWIKEGTSSPL